MGRTVVGQFCAMLILFVATHGSAMGTKRPELMTIAGTVRVVGNEPFTRLVLTAGDPRKKGAGERDYLLVGPLGEELRRGHQGRRVTLEGRTCRSPLPEFADCFEPLRIIPE